MSATITGIFDLLRRDESPADRLHARIRAVRKDVKNALSGKPKEMIIEAQKKAENGVRSGMQPGYATERALRLVAADPTPPNAA